MEKGYLILETGDMFEGEWIGSERETSGEVVFNTSMTGYQEMMTDPSYAGQILAFCYPMIGNYGINQYDNEAFQPALSGVVMGELCEKPSHFQAAENFSDQLDKAGIPGLTGIDTRALVKKIRELGTVKGVLSKNKAADQKLLAEMPPGVEEVSTKNILTFKNNGPHVVLMDYGYKKSILHALLKENCSVTIVPYHMTLEQLKTLKPDGVLFSNGPGDPMKLKERLPEIKKISEYYPSLGICLGHQLLALAHGAQTKKLSFGHRGGNHPVKEAETGKVFITSQNHGYTVIEESIPSSLFEVTFRNVNDKTVEGLQHMVHHITTVQFHPEAHPGPSDTAYIFKSFIEKINPKAAGEISYAVK
ncbi:carbamoyl phosphate synthase small subunit [Bacillus lacus]|uniref:Carbamoyl phosphate synthase small chain n=1 Tax=Metabacillus lacus TaxID=1983721 RepID=A0A7X2IZ59_9BACI|nr:carbamoyl phosphate synthase small subunit [Metabacillus lacus]MRX72467.1 carbamoyl phosphate synthase small subunit [Metabacillus lacus]